MHRRSFLQAGAAASLLGSFPRFALAQQLPYDPRPAGWRTFEVTTRVEILKPTGLIAGVGPGAVGGERLPEGDRQYVVRQRLCAHHERRQVRRRDGGVGMERKPEGPGARGGERFLDAEPGDRFRQAQSQHQDRSGDGEVQRRPDRAHSDRRHRAQDRVRDHARQEHGPAEGAGDLRLDRRQHATQSQDARLRRGRHQVDARDRRPQRQVRGPECALRRPGARGEHPGARRLRPARGAQRIRLSQPRRRQPECDARAALPRRGVPHRLRLGADRSCRRAQGGARGEAPADDTGRSAGAAGARKAVRRLGDELGGLQRGPRREAARLQRAGGRLPHVSRRPRPAASASTAWIRTISSTPSPRAK